MTTPPEDTARLRNGDMPSSPSYGASWRTMDVSPSLQSAHCAGTTRRGRCMGSAVLQGAPRKLHATLFM